MSTAGTTAWIVARTSVQLPADIWLAVIALAAALLAGAIIIAWVSRWHRRGEQDTLSAHDQLTTFRLLYERGELSQDEYQRVRQQLLVRLKSETTSEPTDPSASPPSSKTPSSPRLTAGSEAEGPPNDLPPAP